VNWLVRDAVVMAALARLVEERSSWGFWKCCQRLRLEGCDWNYKRIYRVYRAIQPDASTARCQPVPALG
jgi:putative transposase